MVTVPMEPGVYEVLLGATEEVLATVEITAVRGSSDIEPELVTVDPVRAVLHPAGIGDVAFGTGADDTIARLATIVGPLVERVEVDACVTTGWAAFGGLVVEFRPDEVTGDDVFAAWHYGGANPFTGAFLFSDGSLTTSEGIGLGSTIAQLLGAGATFSGGYDAGWGASLWFTSEEIAGELTTDATNPAATVRSITGGRDRAPARQVC